MASLSKDWCADDPKGSWCGFASIDADGTVLSSAGVDSVVRTGAGIYTVTLSNAMPSTLFGVLATVAETAARDSIEIHYDITSPTTITFTIHEGDNGTAANPLRDRAFTFGIPCGDADGVPCDCPGAGAVIDPATTLPIPDNEVDTAIRTGQVGTSLDYARADHNHPIRRQVHPTWPGVTASGSATLLQDIVLDRRSTEEWVEFEIRTQVSVAAGNNWPIISIPALAGYQQPIITVTNTYRNQTSTYQLDTQQGNTTIDDGAAPVGPYMGIEWSHWSSTRNLYGPFRRENAITSWYIGASIKYVRT